MESLDKGQGGHVFLKQDIMRRVVYSLIPIYVYSVFLYGWRALATGAVVFGLGILAEYVFEKSRNKKVSEAVLVTCLLYSVSLPPAVPFWVAGIGILFAVIMGKGVYGGFGRNIFNPAITGRMFTYISFPVLMQTTWMIPGMFGIHGMNRQATGSNILEAVLIVALVLLVFFLITRSKDNSRFVVITSFLGIAVLIAVYVLLDVFKLRSPEIDVITTATPLELMRGVPWTDIKPGHEYLAENGLLAMFFGFRVGSTGESAIFLIIAAAIYLLVTKTANWKTMIPTVVSALVLSIILYYTGLMAVKLPSMSPLGKDLIGQCADLARFMMSGSLLFVAVFMVTDPVSGPNKPVSQVLYGIIIGSVIIVIRVFSAFPEGTSFAVLIGNTFANLLDEYAPAPKKKPAKVSTKEAVR